MKYTKDEEARAERSSVKMWPGITAGIIIGLIAFVLSFDALRLVFVACGINPYLSWGGPVCVDGTILLCTWATWGFKKGHIRGSAYPWVGLVLFSSFSIAGNALHAMLNTGFHLPAWVPPVIMSIPPVALLYATHLIVIIAGDRLDKINTVLPVGLTVMEDTDVPAPVPAPSAMPAPAIPSEPPASAPEPAEPAKPEIPDLFDFQTIVPAMEDDAAPKADEAEAPAADASTPTVEQHAIPQPVVREPVIIPTLTIQPDERDAPTVDGQDEPAPEPVGPDVTAVEPADVPEEKTDDAQAEEKPKPGKTSRRGKAGADDEAWLAWIDELTAKGENPTASKAVDAGLAASGSTAKRYLARIRREHSERF